MVGFDEESFDRNREEEIDEVQGIGDDKHNRWQIAVADSLTGPSNRIIC